MELQKRPRANGTGLPAASLYEIRDCIALALDATENRQGYTLPQREARSYMRAALHQTDKLIGGGA